MRLGYFTMPVQPQHRHPAETLKEDREAIMLADRLGYHDAFVGEHLTDRIENITNSMMFLATLIHSTKTIKLASGTANLSHMHPVLVAAQAAMFDHLAEGRFIFGISPGALVSDAEALGILGEDRNRMFAEAIDVILAIWERDPPYGIDFPGNRFKVTTETTLHPPTGPGIELTELQIRLMNLFVPGRQTLQRKIIAETLANKDLDAEGSLDERIEACISRLRRRIEENGINPSPIKTVRGVGYLFAAPLIRVD